MLIAREVAIRTLFEAPIYWATLLIKHSHTIISRVLIDLFHKPGRYLRILEACFSLGFLPNFNKNTITLLYEYGTDYLKTNSLSELSY